MKLEWSGDYIKIRDCDVIHDNFLVGFLRPSTSRPGTDWWEFQYYKTIVSPRDVVFEEYQVQDEEAARALLMTICRLHYSEVT